MRLLPHLVALTVLFGSPALAAAPAGCEEDSATCKEDCTMQYGGNGNAIKKLSGCFATCTDQRTQCVRRFNAVNNRAPDAPEAAPERRGSKTEAAKLRDIQEKDRKREEDPFGDNDNPVVRERPARDAYDDPPEPPPERKAYRASDEKPSRTAAAPPRRAEPPPRPPPEKPVAAEPVVARPVAAEPVVAEPVATKSPEPDIEAFAPPPERQDPPPSRTAAKPVVAEPTNPDTTEDDLLPPPPPPVAKKEPPPRIKEPPRPTVPAEPARKDISEWDPNGD